MSKPFRNKKLYANLFILLGLLIIIIPLIITHQNNLRNNEIIDDFLQHSNQALAEADSLKDENPETFYIPDLSGDTSANSLTIDSEDSSQELKENESDYSSYESSAQSQSTNKSKKPLMSKEEIQRRMTGVLIIEKIDLRMIIMDGTDEETLRVAAGRVPGTGKIGETGNCVLAGHRNYTFGKYFNRLDELDTGDEIIIKTPDKEFKYEVYKKHIVEPDDLSVIEQSDTEKILTLFTCHPVAIASHRLVVHSRMIE